MHNNYYFIKRLSSELKLIIAGKKLQDCYSQEKDDLIFVFSAGLVIRCHFTRQFSCLSFPETPNRAKRNTVNLFQDLIGLEVMDLVQHENERSFRLHFSDSYVLLFKLHGNNSNLILYRNETLISMFKNSLKNDAEILYKELNRPIQQDSQSVQENGIDVTFPTFGKDIREQLRERVSDDNDDNLWHHIETILAELQNSVFYVYRGKKGVKLSLFRPDCDYDEYSSPMEAITAFFADAISGIGFDREQGQLLNSLSSKIKRTKSYISKVERQLKKVQNSTNYKVWGDNLMANLYTISKGKSSVTLNNVYDGEPITIKINPRLSIQDNAERLYKKYKNQHIEINNLQNSLKRKKKELSRYLETEKEIKAGTRIRDLRKIVKDVGLDVAGSPQQLQESKPYWEKEMMGFRILVGKNAKANDEMLRNYSRKNDLWLHAKDVPGSHVLIMHRPNQNFPKPVIERAASWAAWYSKRKNDTLCPVICTPRKFVRKRKGDPPGAVVVEKEEILLVSPLN